MELKGVWNTPFKVQQEPHQYQKQAVDDGMIEVVSYRNEVSLMLERSVHMAKKVTQGRGPYIMKFK